MGIAGQKPSSHFGYTIQTDRSLDPEKLVLLPLQHCPMYDFYSPILPVAFHDHIFFAAFVNSISVRLTPLKALHYSIADDHQHVLELTAHGLRSDYGLLLLLQLW